VIWIFNGFFHDLASLSTFIRTCTGQVHRIPLVVNQEDMVKVTSSINLSIFKTL